MLLKVLFVTVVLLFELPPLDELLPPDGLEVFDEFDEVLDELFFLEEFDVFLLELAIVIVILSPLDISVPAATLCLMTLPEVIELEYSSVNEQESPELSHAF